MIDKKLYHFWYSQTIEERGYENFAVDAEFGMINSISIPRWNTCLVEVCGEEIEQHYTHCSEKLDAYDSLNIKDAVYLGVGFIGSLSQMKLPQIVERMRELGMIVPTALLRV